jgi:virginiamycin A acetyltransferase
LLASGARDHVIIAFHFSHERPESRRPAPDEGFPARLLHQEHGEEPEYSRRGVHLLRRSAGAEDFEKNVLYHYPFVGDKLILGKFCAIATGAKFIMNGANHKISGLSTYPFPIFGQGWEKALPSLDDLPYKGDTVIGNDVWIGYEAMILPGFTSATAQLSRRVPW